MGFVSKPMLEGLVGLDGRLQFTVCVVQSSGGYHHSRSKERSSPSMVPNQHCGLTRLSCNDFPHIHITRIFIFICIYIYILYILYIIYIYTHTHIYIVIKEKTNNIFFVLKVI